jgi:hypothetical protein
MAIAGVLLEEAVEDLEKSPALVGRELWITDYLKLRPVCGLWGVVSGVGRRPPATPRHLR